MTLTNLYDFVVKSTLKTTLHRTTASLAVNRFMLNHDATLAATRAMIPAISTSWINMNGIQDTYTTQINES